VRRSGLGLRFKKALAQLLKEICEGTLKGTASIRKLMLGCCPEGSSEDSLPNVGIVELQDVKGQVEQAPWLCAAIALQCPARTIAQTLARASQEPRNGECVKIITIIPAVAGLPSLAQNFNILKDRSLSDT
jgi:hypothetical protein